MLAKLFWLMVAIFFGHADRLLADVNRNCALNCPMLCTKFDIEGTIFKAFNCCYAPRISLKKKKGAFMEVSCKRILTCRCEVNFFSPFFVMLFQTIWRKNSIFCAYGSLQLRT